MFKLTKRQVNYKNVKIGYLTAIEPIAIKASRVVWKCKCECGNVVELSTKEFKRKNHCGCKLGCKRKNLKAWAFGEEKSLIQWADDCRCIVTYNTLKRRITHGWSCERAMLSQHLPSKYTSKKYKAFNEEKTIENWCEDDRCVVKNCGVLFNRINILKWSVEKSITTPIDLRRNAVTLTAFGETKSIKEWTNDRRCVISHRVLLNRINYGWETEKAITTSHKNKILHKYDYYDKFRIDCSYKEISQSFWNRIVDGAERRSLELNITVDYAWNKFIKQNKCCALLGVELHFGKPPHYINKPIASMDRIDSSKGYTKDNVQWIHKKLQPIKGDTKDEQFIEICKQVYLNNQGNITKIERPNWIDYFIGIAFLISTRSIDARTQHGCVITNNKYQIIGTGYNSFVEDSFDEILPNTNELKYQYMQHSEINAITNARKFSDSDLIAFITGKPCFKCLQALYQFGVRVIYSYDRYGWMKDKNEEFDFDFFIKSHDMKYEIVKSDLSYILKLPSLKVYF